MSGLEILLLVGPFVVPFLVGLKVESVKRGLIPLAALPTFSFFAGFAILFGLSLFKHDDLELVLVAVLLMAAGVYLGCVFSVCWGLGHLIRDRRQTRRNSKPPALIAEPSPVVETTDDPEVPGTHPGVQAFRSTPSAPAGSRL